MDRSMLMIQGNQKNKAKCSLLIVYIKCDIILVNAKGLSTFQQYFFQMKKKEEARGDMIDRSSNLYTPSDKLSQTNEQSSVASKNGKLPSKDQKLTKTQEVKNLNNVIIATLLFKIKQILNPVSKDLQDLNQRVKTIVQDELYVALQLPLQVVKDLEEKVNKIKNAQANRENNIQFYRENIKKNQKDMKKEQKGPKEESDIEHCLNYVYQKLTAWSNKYPSIKKEDILNAQMQLKTAMEIAAEFQKRYIDEKEKRKQLFSTLRLNHDDMIKFFSEVKSSNLSEKEKNQKIADFQSKVENEMSKYKKPEPEPQIKEEPMSNSHPGLEGSNEVIYNLSRASETGRSCGGTTNDGRP